MNLRNAMPDLCYPRPVEGDPTKVVIVMTGNISDLKISDDGKRFELNRVIELQSIMRFRAEFGTLIDECLRRFGFYRDGGLT